MPRFPRSPFVDLFKIFGIVVFGGAALAPAAAAQDVLVKEIDETFDWIPGQFQNAAPMELPVATMTMEELLEWTADPEARLFPELPEDDSGLERFDGIGAESRDGDAFEPRDVGQAGAWFSSSRLIPSDARMHYPYRTVGKLFFVVPGLGEGHCSAAVIRPRLVLTAVHCVHQGSGGADGFFQSFVFVPAYHEGNAP
jgi:hypothetical protein